MFESPVRSGLFTSKAQDRDRDRSFGLHRLPKTGPNRCRPVQCGLLRSFAVTRPVLTSYGWHRFVTGLDRSCGYKSTSLCVAGTMDWINTLLNIQFTKLRSDINSRMWVSLSSMCYLASRLCRPIPCLLYPSYLFELRVKVPKGGDEVDVESNVETNPPPGSLLQTREVEWGWQRWTCVLLHSKKVATRWRRAAIVKFGIHHHLRLALACKGDGRRASDLASACSYT